jgi:hypothetical protein
MTTASSNTILSENMTALRARYPALSKRVTAFSQQNAVRIFRAQDGSPGYAVTQQGKTIPLTNPNNPAQIMQAQLDRMARQIADFTRPVLIVGFHSGSELLAIFDQCEQDTSPHARQPIYVLVDSTATLLGFLTCFDARRVIESHRVQLIWHEEWPSFIEHLGEHPEIPHIMSLLSGAPESILQRFMPALIELAQQRDREMKDMIAANNDYYDAIQDQPLAEILSGKGDRAPRLMMPTCSWSTFIQHSTRDTCRDFEAAGWETRTVITDAMLTPYYLVKQIHEFKPDLFIFIDHLRSEAEELYPRNMMFVTWIQDEMDHLMTPIAGDKIREYAQERKRDLVVGYNPEGTLTRQYGYPAERFVHLPIKADPRIFRPVSLSEQDRKRYGCELAFMTNTSMASDQLVEQRIIPAVEKHGLPAATVQAIHDHLWTLYRNGETRCARRSFLIELFSFDEFAQVYGPLDATNLSEEQQAIRQELLRWFYWRLNDTIYRHTVIEWADQLGLDLHLYGHGWEQHPTFGKYARGVLAHGPELNLAYHAAGSNLHLNISQGMHQRVWEIRTAQASILFRQREAPIKPQPSASVMRKLRDALGDHNKDTDLERIDSLLNDAALASLVFQLAKSFARQADDDQPVTTEQIHGHVLDELRSRIETRPDWLFDDFDHLTFHNATSLAAKIEEKLP